MNNGKSQKILVTGGAGFIGSQIVDYFLEEGFQVVIVDNLCSSSLSNINPKAEFYKADICDKEISSIFAKERPDYVNHHAVKRFSRNVKCTPMNDVEVGILGSLNLIENSILYGVKHFLLASCGNSVYGDPIYLPCNESHPLLPQKSEGICKCAVERYLRAYAKKYEIKHTILRYPEVYGPRQNLNGERNLIGTFINQMLDGRQPIIYGDGDQRRDFIYVDDCVEANFKALQSENSGGIYNLGTGLGTSINTIFTALKEIIACYISPIFHPVLEDEVQAIYLDAEKARRNFGWFPKTDLLEGLRKTVSYYAREEVRF
jgi:UDP-glucose 4-epimerase